MIRNAPSARPRKSLLALFGMVILVAVFLTACGGSDAPEANPPQVDNPGTENETAANPASEESGSDAGEPDDPADDPAVDQSATGDVSFSADVHPILESRCLTCHGGDQIKAGLVMFTYEDLMAGSENGAVIIPGDVENSLLAELIISKKMPKKGPKLNPTQTQTILDWIAQGAQNN